MVNGCPVIINEQWLRRLIYQHVHKVPTGQWGDSAFVWVRDDSERRTPRETHGWPQVTSDGNLILKGKKQKTGNNFEKTVTLEKGKHSDLTGGSIKVIRKKEKENKPPVMVTVEHLGEKEREERKKKK